MSLIIVMGINWIFGVLLLHKYLLPLIYLFAISTAVQVRSLQSVRKGIIITLINELLVKVQALSTINLL